MDFLYIENDDYYKHYLAYVFSSVSFGRLAICNFMRSPIKLASKYDAIFIDIKEGKYPPIDLLNYIRRKNSINQATPIIGFISCLEAEYIDSLNVLNFYSIIKKPINLSILNRSLHSIMSRQPIQRL